MKVKYPTVFDFVLPFFIIFKSVEFHGYEKCQKNLEPNERRPQITIRGGYENHMVIDTEQRCEYRIRTRKRNANDFKRKWYSFRLYRDKINFRISLKTHSHLS